MTANKVMTQEEFRKEGGDRCPCCRSLDVHPGKFFQDEDGVVRRAVRCYDCGHAYHELYKLSGYDRD